MKKNYNENLVAGAAIRDDKGRRISKLFEAPHPKMTVGYARNLIMPSDPEEQEFNFRQSGGGVIEDGVAVIDKVKGNSVVWNQQCKVASGSFPTSNLSVVASEDGVLINGTASQMTSLSSVTSCPTARVVGHKYLLKGCPSGGSNSTYSFRYNSNGFSENGKGVIVTCVAAGASVASDQILETYTPVICIANGVECNNLLFRPRLIDLTQMFGAGNEPSTYEEFLQRKPKVADEYAYNEGTIVNNKVEAIKTSGVNLWDEEWELGAISSSTGANVPSSSDIRSKNYIPVMPGTTYYCKCPKSSLNVRYYDANKNFLADFNTAIENAFTVPSGAHYLRFWRAGTTYTHDICINLSDPTINGKYFPYEKHELDLSWVKDIKNTEGVKLFEDGLKSAGTAFDEVGKNKAVKRIAVSTFNGTEAWRINPFAQDKGIMAYQCYGKLIPINCNIRCDRFVTRYWGVLSPMTIFAIPKDGIIIETDGAQSLDDFKASLKAKPLEVYYELAESIEVEYDEKSLTYPVIAGGTEEAIASEPSSAFRADIGYGIDAVKTILDLKARVEALERK